MNGIRAAWQQPALSTVTMEQKKIENLSIFRKEASAHVSKIKTKN